MKIYSYSSRSTTYSPDFFIQKGIVEKETSPTSLFNNFSFRMKTEHTRDNEKEKLSVLAVATAAKVDEITNVKIQATKENKDAPHFAEETTFKQFEEKDPRVAEMVKKCLTYLVEHTEVIQKGMPRIEIKKDDQLVEHKHKHHKHHHHKKHHAG